MTSENHRLQEAIDKTRMYNQFDDRSRAFQAMSSDLREILVYLSDICPAHGKDQELNGRIRRLIEKINATIDDSALSPQKHDPVILRLLSIKIIATILMEIV